MRFNRQKVNPSGGRPSEFLRRPAHYGGADQRLVVPEALIANARAILDNESIPRFIDAEQQIDLDYLYQAINAPDINLDTAWTVWDIMVDWYRQHAPVDLAAQHAEGELQRD